MTDASFLIMLGSSAEPTSHLLFECGTILDSAETDSHITRLIGIALDRWGISKEELKVRNRLNVVALNDFLECEPTLQPLEVR